MNNIYYFFIIIFLASCSAQHKEEHEGIILYNISVGGVKKNNLAHYVPTQTLLQFNGSKTALSLGVKSFFNFKQISKPDENKNLTALTIMGKTYLYETQCGNLAYGYTNKVIEDIEKTKERKVICGYKCKKAIITWRENTEKTTVYYTNEIKINQPNINTPFKEIDGVLLAFEANVIGLDLKFEAQKVLLSKVDSSTFGLPQNYEKVDYKKFDKIVEGFK